MIKTIKKSIIWWLVFSLTITLFWITYATFVNISNVNSTDTLTSTLMNNIIDNQNDLDTRVSMISTSWSIPTWAIMAFNLSTCPSGWIPADWTSWTIDLRWQFLRWMNTFDWWVTIRADWKQDSTNRTLWNREWDDFKQHNHTYAQPYACYDWVDSTTVNSWDTCFTTWNTWNIWWAETRPKNVAILYCIKS